MTTFNLFIEKQLFEKHVVLDSLAVYWRPKANLFSNETKATGSVDDDVIDLMFDSNIGTVEKPAAKLVSTIQTTFFFLADVAAK